MRKFIPGTNGQYSLDDQGRLWSHYQMDKFGGVHKRLIQKTIKKSNRGYAVSQLGYPEKEYSIKAWMIKLFFNDWRPRVGQRYDFIDGDKMNCAVNNLVMRTDEQIRATKLARNRRRNKRVHEQLTKCAIASSIGLKSKELPDDLYQLIRSLRLAKRRLAEKKGVHVNAIG